MDDYIDDESLVLHTASSITVVSGLVHFLIYVGFESIGCMLLEAILI